MFKHTVCMFMVLAALQAATSHGTPQLEWNPPQQRPVLGEFDPEHPGLEFRISYEMWNTTPGDADADILTSLQINAANGATLNFYRVVVVQGNLWLSAATPSSVTFEGSIPPAEYFLDSCFMIWSYADANSVVSSNGTITADSELHGPFNTLSGVWVALKPAPRPKGTLMIVR